LTLLLLQPTTPSIPRTACTCVGMFTSHAVCLSLPPARRIFLCRDVVCILCNTVGKLLALRWQLKFYATEVAVEATRPTYARTSTYTRTKTAPASDFYYGVSPRDSSCHKTYICPWKILKLKQLESQKPSAGGIGYRCVCSFVQKSWLYKLYLVTKTACTTKHTKRKQIKSQNYTKAVQRMKHNSNGCACHQPEPDQTVFRKILFQPQVE